MIYKKDDIKRIRIKVTEEMLDDMPLMKHLIRDAKNKIISGTQKDAYIIELMII
jgi:hypothetical protein